MDNLTNNNYDRDDFFPFSNNAGSNSKNENMYSFSSWGPSPDLELKPEITAPGGNIKSTVYNDSYETESGTSMASPNVAGGCALILQSLKHKNIDYSQDINKVDIIKCLMMNTAKVLTNSSTGVIYSPRQQGAGLMQLEKAVNNNVIVTDDRKKPYIALKNIHSNSVSYYTKAIRKKGRVDHKDSFLDSNVIEKERGITIFSEQAIFDINNSRYYLIDTPGHMDFSPEMERAIKVLDYAIILLSAVEGIQGNTKTVYNLLQKNNVPVFFFINKDDREGSDYCNVIKDLKANLNKNIYYLDYDLSNGLKEELIEFICEYDDSLMEKYLKGNYHEDLWINTLVNLIKHRKVFIASKGSALLDTEVSTFINNLDKLTKTSYDNSAKFSGKIYKITHDDSKQGISNNKIVWEKY